MLISITDHASLYCLILNNWVVLDSQCLDFLNLPKLLFLCRGC